MANDGLDIAQIESAVRQYRAGWTAGWTPLTELSPEQRRLRLGAVPPDDDVSLAEREKATQAAASEASPAGVPTAVDLRTEGYITPIRDQGACGSCVSFGSIAAIEGTARVQAKKPDLVIDLSEAQLFYCHAASQGRNCSNGWWVDPSLTACRNKGVVAEEVFPYTAGNQACRVGDDSSAERYKIVDYTKIKNVGQMKEWLAAEGPLVACFLVYEDFYAYRSGVYRHVQGQSVGGHCVLIAGYDDSASCWIAKNSWGTGWGEGGYFRIGYGECGIDFEMWGVTVPKFEEEDGDWIRDSTITGLWLDNEGDAAAAYVDGSGWKRLPGGPNRSTMATMLAAAKVSKAPTDLRLIDDVITEIYVL